MSNLKRHSNSLEHRRATDRLARQLKVVDEVEEREPDVSFKDKVLFKTVYCVAMEEIPSSKVNALLTLQQVNGVNLKYRNLSWDTITEIQRCLCDTLVSKVVNEINDSSLFGIQMDESTDIGMSKKTVCPLSGL